MRDYLVFHSDAGELSVALTLFEGRDLDELARVYYNSPTVPLSRIGVNLSLIKLTVPFQFPRNKVPLFRELAWLLFETKQTEFQEWLNCLRYMLIHHWGQVFEELRKADQATRSLLLFLWLLLFLDARVILIP